MAFLAAACHRQGEVAEDTSGRLVVTAHIASTDTLRDTIVVPGTVVPALAADLTVFAPESARILEMPKAEGEHVQAGDLLVRYELASADTAEVSRQTAVRSAQTRLDTAKAELAHQTQLYSQGVIPRNTYDAARSAADRAQTALNEVIVQTKAEAATSDRSRVVAPFAGVIAKRWHNPGDPVNAVTSDPIIRVIDPSRVQVVASVPPAALARIQPGQPATVTPVATGSAGEAATVTMRPMGASTDVAPTNTDVRLAFTGPTTLTLDTVVKVEIVLDERANVVVIPAGAIAKDDTSSYVMVAGPDGRAHRHDVRVGLISHDRAEIREGLSSGDEVIVGALDQIVENQPIAIDRGR